MQRLTNTYQYKTDLGETIPVERWEWFDDTKKKKRFNQTKKTNGKFLPYNSDKIAEDPFSKIVICEGEKCVDALNLDDVIPITGIGGASAITRTNWECLANKEVIIWPDNDQPGEKWKEHIVKTLGDLNCQISEIHIPDDKPEKWDAADATLEESQKLIAAAKPVEIPKSIGVDLGMTIRAYKDDIKPHTGVLTDPEQFEVLKRLPKAEMKRGGYWMACCPAHDDKNPSLKFGLKDGKLIGPKCYANCSFDAILEAANIKNQKISKPWGDGKTGPLVIPEGAQPLILERFSDIIPRETNWIIPEWLAQGQLTLLAGMPGKGKTTLAMKIASLVTTGGKWPSGDALPKGEVLFFTNEDNPETTISRNLIANQADRTKIYNIKKAYDPKEKDYVHFDPSIHLPQLIAGIEQKPDIRLIIIDPILSVIAGLKDEYKAASIRARLSPLTEFAMQRDIGILGITHFVKRHNAKGSTVQDWTIGSQAWVGVCRMQWAVGKMENNELVLMKSKTNEASEEGGYKYAVEKTQIHSGEKVMMGMRVDFGEEVPGYVDDVLNVEQSSPKEEESKSKTEEAMDFIRLFFDTSDGPVHWSVVEQEAHAAGGINAGTLKSARARMRKEIGSFKEAKQNGSWLWHKKS